MKFSKLNIPIYILTVTYIFFSIYILFHEYANFGPIIYYKHLTFINFTNYYKIYLIAIFSTIILPLFFYFKSKYEQEIFPIFYLLLIYFFFTYFLYYFFNNFWETKRDVATYVVSQSAQAVYYSMKVLLYGLISLNFGYFINRYFFKNLNLLNRYKVYFKIKNNKEQLTISIISTILTLLIFYILKIQNIFPQINQIKYLLLYLSLALCVYSFFFIKSKFRILWVAPYLYIFFSEILTGSLVFPFMLIFFVYFLSVFIKKRLFILPILLILITANFFHSIKNEYRNFAWYNNLDKIENYSHANSFDKFLVLTKIFKKNIVNHYNFDITFTKKKFFQRNISRLVHSAESLILITDLTPSTVDYYNGSTYKILLSKIVPRIFWKNKPSDTLANEAGRKYKILDKDDKSTSWNLPVLSEFYANFGNKGVVFGMFLVGLFFALMSSFFKPDNGRHNSYSRTYIPIIGISALFPTVFFETHLSLILGAFFQTIIFGMFYIFFLKKFLIRFQNI